MKELATLFIRLTALWIALTHMLPAFGGWLEARAVRREFVTDELYVEDVASDFVMSAFHTFAVPAVFSMLIFLAAPGLAEWVMRFLPTSTVGDLPARMARRVASFFAGLLILSYGVYGAAGTLPDIAGLLSEGARDHGPLTPRDIEGGGPYAWAHWLGWLDVLVGAGLVLWGRGGDRTPASAASS